MLPLYQFANHIRYFISKIYANELSYSLGQ